MGHDHGHGHHHHHHAGGNLKVAFWLNISFTILEGVGGVWVNSMAILSDALHDLGDSLALGIAWFLEGQSRKGPSKLFTFGRQRFSLLGALLNSLILITGSIIVISEAIPRLMNPEPSYAPGMLGLAILGILINGAAVLKLSASSSLNERMVRIHLMEDVLGWAAVLIVSIVLLFVDWYILDPLLSLGITAYILIGVFKNLRSTLVILLQGSPDSLELSTIEEALLELPQVHSLHHTHLWTLDGENHVFTSHAVLCNIESLEDISGAKIAINETLVQFSLSHFTVATELDGEPCQLKEGAHQCHDHEHDHVH